jgi:hypothetical protein
VSLQDRCTVCAKRKIALKSFWTHPMVVLGDVAQVGSCSVRLEMAFVSVQDRSTVCAKRTIGLVIVLDAPDGTPR